MTPFIDPRADPSPEATPRADRTTTDPDELDDLRQLCREGRLYDVERWIQNGRPLQLSEGRPPGRSRWESPLKIALQAGNHALLLLLLSNGYDPNREHRSPLNLTLTDRRWDLLDILLEWGGDPQQVDLHKLFDTYNSDLFERFRKLGIDLTAGHVLGETLGHHTSNTPLFGFAKRHREDNPKIQTELNIALGYHAREGNSRGVGLCLWAGADPHAPAPDPRFWEEPENAEEDHFVGFSAVYHACSHGHVEVLEELGPDPAQDNFDGLYCTADWGSVVDFLADIALPEDPDEVVRRQLWWATRDLGPRFGRGRSLRPLQRLFEKGVRWEQSSKEEIRNVRGCLLKAPDRKFVEAMKLLAKDDHCSAAVLHELGRTKAIRRRMKEVGFIPPETDDREDRSRWRRQRPTRYQEVLKRFGVEKPKQKKSKQTRREHPLPHTVHIGHKRAAGKKIEMDRKELFERVWSTPVYKLAEEWGLSGTGLRKRCQRLKVPTPGRGYWQKVKAGKQVRRPKLPELKSGRAEEILVWTSE